MSLNLYKIAAGVMTVLAIRYGFDASPSLSAICAGIAVTMGITALETPR